MTGNTYNAKRKIAFLLCLTMLAPAVVSCSETTVEEESESTPAETVVSAGESESETESETEQLKPNIPELKFDGRTFTVTTTGPSSGDWENYDMFADTLTGEPINDAVFTRNEYINTTYDVQIAVMKASDPSTEIRMEVRAASGDIQAGIVSLDNLSSLSQTGSLANLYALPYIDTAQPWWDTKTAEELEVKDKLFFATGDITVTDDDATWVLFFNKQMVVDFGLDDLYTLVREDKWMTDTFSSMISTVSDDLNGDGQMMYDDDRFGFTTHGDCCPGLFYASGLRTVEKGGEGENLFVLSDELEKMQSVVETAGKLMSDQNTTFLRGREGSDSTGIQILFEEQRSLFYGEVLQCATRMRASETAFGLLPWPKYTEDQDRYYNWINTYAGRGVVVPVSVPEQDYEMTGAILEAMAAKSKYTVREAYFDKNMTYKSLRDEDSIEMLNIILDSRTVDIGRVYNLSITSGIMNLISAGDTNVSSTWEKNLKSTTKILDKIIDKFEELE